MKIKDKKPKKIAKKPAQTEHEKPKKISKTWAAVLELKGTGKILDMKAVLK